MKIILSIILVFVQCANAEAEKLPAHADISTTTDVFFKTQLRTKYKLKKTTVDLESPESVSKLGAIQLEKLISANEPKTLNQVNKLAKLNLDDDQLREHSQLMSKESIPLNLYIREFLFDRLFQEVYEAAPPQWYLDRIKTRYTLKKLAKLDRRKLEKHLNTYYGYAELVDEINILLTKEKMDTSDNYSLSIIIDSLIEVNDVDASNKKAISMLEKMFNEIIISHYIYGTRISNQNLHGNLSKKKHSDLINLYFKNYRDSRAACRDGSAASVARKLIQMTESQQMPDFLPQLLKHEQSSIVTLSYAFSKLWKIDPSLAISSIEKNPIAQHDKVFQEFLSELKTQGAKVDAISIFAHDTLKEYDSDSLKLSCCMIMLTSYSDLLKACEIISNHKEKPEDELFSTVLLNMQPNDQSLISLFQFLFKNNKQYEIGKLISKISTESISSRDDLSNYLAECLATQYELLYTASAISIANILRDASLNANSIEAIKKLLDKNHGIYKNQNHIGSAHLLYAHILSSCVSFGSKITDVHDIIVENLNPNESGSNHCAALLVMAKWPKDKYLDPVIFKYILSILNREDCPMFSLRNFNISGSRFSHHEITNDYILRQQKNTISLKIQCLEMLQKHQLGCPYFREKINYNLLNKQYLPIVQATGLDIHDYFLRE